MLSRFIVNFIFRKVKDLFSFNLHREVNNNKGFTSLFLILILGSIISFLAIFNYFIIEVSNKNINDNLFRLAGRSILADFDLDLFKEFRIFGFYKNESEIESLVKSYANNKVNEGSIFKADLKTYSLLDIKNFKSQIIKTKFDYKNYLNKKNLRNKDELKDLRILRNESYKESLPSYGYRTGGIKYFGEQFSEKIKGIIDFENYYKNAVESSIIDQYLISNFNSSLYTIKDDDNFFKCELEYILEGKYSDEDNYKGVYNKISLVRIALNSLHILSSPKKMSEVNELAALGNIIGPEGAVLASGGIILLWASKEAENDISLLKDGYKVPFIKSETTFLLNDFQSVISKSAGETIYPKVNKGQDYFDYLKFFLLFLDEKEKLLRIMDLIQINMKTKYNRNFVLRNRYIGFSIDVDLGSNSFSYIQNY